MVVDILYEFSDLLTGDFICDDFTELCADLFELVISFAELFAELIHSYQKRSEGNDSTVGGETCGSTVTI